MEKCAEAAATETISQPISSQVVFIDIPHSYPPATPVTCCYTVTAFQPSNKDWVGVFKMGWSKTRNYHTFVWVDPCQDEKGHRSEKRQAVFSDYYLPKDETEFYQFCYVDGAGQVRGASTPFCFRESAAQNTESFLDDNLLIVTTQEQLEENTREKDEMQTQLNYLIEENETLKSALEREGQTSAILKRQNEQNKRENTQLVKEMAQIMKEKEILNTNPNPNPEMDHLKSQEQKKQTAECGTAEQERRQMNLAAVYMQAKVAVAMEESKNMMRIAKQLKEELLQVKAQLDDVTSSYKQAQQKSEKQEAELKEAREVIADKVAIIEEKERLIATMSKEKNKFSLLNQDLFDDLERLCRCFEFQAAPPAGSLPELAQPDVTEDANARHRPEMSEQPEQLCAVGEPGEVLLVRRH